MKTLITALLLTLGSTSLVLAGSDCTGCGGGDKDTGSTDFTLSCGGDKGGDKDTSGEA